MKFIKNNFLKTIFTLIAAIFLFSACKKSTSTSTDSNNLDAVINANGDLTIFAAAIKKTRLDVFTQGGGPFTIFAPTNAALSAAGINSVADLNTIDSNILVQILTYHIQAVSRTYPEIPLGPNATMSTQGGFTQYASRYIGGSAYINGAKIISEDIKTSNGVLYIINKVLIPPFTSVLVNLSTTPNFSLMYQAIIRTGLSVNFSPATTAPITVFAISNADMTAAGYDATTIAGLTGAGLTALTNILKYHVVPQRIFSPDFKSGNLKTSLVILSIASNVLVGANAGGAVTIKGANNTTAFALTPLDILSTNGVIQGVSGVLKP